MLPLTRRQFIGAATGLVLARNAIVTPARALTINPRSAWGHDLPPQGPLDSEDVRFLIVHHSASHNGHTAVDVPDILRGWYRFHTGPDKGWPDIAYNFIIDSEGGIWEGRQGSLDGPVAGSATGGNQGFTQLVCVIGDTNEAAPTPAATSALVSVLAWLGDRYAVPTSPGSEVEFTSRGSNRWPSGTLVKTPTIAGHRDMSQTSCPGSNLYSYVSGSLMADVDAARQSSNSVPTTTTTSTTRTSTTTTTAAEATTTTLAPTTTTVVPSTTMAVTPTTTLPVLSTTTPLAIGTSTPVAGAPTGLIVAAASVLLAGAGIVVWRNRRMGD